jgi:hypothetical protein
LPGFRRCRTWVLGTCRGATQLLQASCPMVPPADPAPVPASTSGKDTDLACITVLHVISCGCAGLAVPLGCYDQRVPLFWELAVEGPTVRRKVSRETLGRLLGAPSAAPRLSKSLALRCEPKLGIEAVPHWTISGLPARQSRRTTCTLSIGSRACRNPSREGDPSSS